MREICTKHFVSVILLIFFHSSGLASAADPWWDADWSKRKQLLFDNTGQSTNLVNFPILVTIDSTQINFLKTQDAGEDIRFVNSDGTALFYEIEEWDESGTCSVWVKVPQIDASSDTDYIWIYYSNDLASDGQSAANVWDANYQLVWHGREVGGTTVIDSTSNGNHGSKLSSTEPSPVSNGQIGGAQLFDGIDDGVEVEDLESSLNITIEAWIRPDSFPSEWSTIAQFIYDSPYMGLENSNIAFYNDDEVLLSPTAIPTGEWTHTVVTHSGEAASIFLNGSLDSVDDIDSSAVGTDLHVGVWEVGTTDSPFDGQIDELRISTVVRSADWIAAQYLSMTDAFVTWETPRPRVVLWNEVSPE